MQVILLRHGETDWNLQGRCQGSTDLELNEIGLRKAREVAASLRAERIDAVYCSDLRRAVQTADAICQGRSLKVMTDGDLRELDHGEFEGLTFAQIRAAYPDFMRQWRSEPAELLIPGGERLVDVQRRAWRAMERIARSHLPHETVAVVSHQFPISAILCLITGTPLNQYRSFHLDPCSFRRVAYHGAGAWRIHAANGDDPFAGRNLD